jgi:hypothetical protein
MMQRTELFSSQAAFNFGEVFIANCLPNWFPSLSLICCTAIMCVAGICQLVGSARRFQKITVSQEEPSGNRA